MAAESTIPERVFVSYSHEGNPHDSRVLDLTDQLRKDGIDARCDRYVQAPAEGWPKWMDDQIRDASFVLVVCTKAYLERLERKSLPTGKGVIWESTLFYQLMYDAAANARAIPVLLPGAETDDIPNPLKSATYYKLQPPFSLENHDGYEDLYRRITAQPSVEVPTLGPRRALPAVNRPNQNPPAAKTRESPSPGPANPDPAIQQTPPSKVKASDTEPEGPKPASLADISTVIGLVVNFIAIISFVLGKTSTNQLLALVGTMWAFSVYVAIAWPPHRRVAVCAVVALPLLLGSGFLAQQWWRKCPQAKVCIVFAPFDADDHAMFAKGIRRALEDLKANYPELKDDLWAPNDDEERSFTEAKNTDAMLAFWGEFTPAGPTGQGTLTSAYRIFGMAGTDILPLSKGTLFQTSGAPQDGWKIQVDVNRKAVYLTKVALGIAAWNRNDFETSVARLSDALDGSPPPGVEPAARAVVYIYRGKSLVQRLRYAEAIDDYNNALALDQSQTAAWRELGRAYLAENLFPKAIESFTECIARDPTDAAAFDGRGLARLRQGVVEAQNDPKASLADLAAAEEDIGRAIHLKPDLSSAYYDLGQLHLAENDKRSARADFDSAVDHGPKDGKAYAWQGYILIQLGEYRKAIEAYNHAEEYASTPHDTEPEVRRAAAYMADGQFNAAIIDLTKVLTCQPNKNQVCDSNEVTNYENRALAYDQLKRFDEAIADFAQAILRETNRVRQAKLHYEVGAVFNEKDDAVRALRDAASLTTTADDRWQIAALTNLTVATTLDKSLARAYLEQSAVYTKRGDKEHAIAALQDCARSATDDTRNTCNQRLIQLRGTATNSR